MAISESLGDLRTLEIEDGRIEYRIRGEGPGPALVFLHGIIANADVWRGVVSDLAFDHRCVVPDWPLGGHRLGMRPGTDFSLPGIARMVERFLVDGGGSIRSCWWPMTPAAPWPNTSSPPTRNGSPGSC